MLSVFSRCVLVLFHITFLRAWLPDFNKLKDGKDGWMDGWISGEMYPRPMLPPEISPGHVCGWHDR